MNTLCKRGLFAMGVCVVQCASADPLDIGLRQLDRVTLEAPSEASASGRVPMARAMTEKKPAPPNMMLLTGLTYVDQQGDASAVATPFGFVYTPLPWIVQVSGLGFAQFKRGDATTSGFNDVNLAGGRVDVLTPHLALREILEVSVPVGGHLGSKHLAEDAQLTALGNQGAWKEEVTAVLARSETEIPGISRYTKFAIGKVVRNFANESAVVGQFKRSFTQGLKPVSVALAGYDFAIVPAKVHGLLSISRGLTEGSHDTAYEFDLETIF